MKRRPVWITVCVGLLVWSYFARPVYDYARIAAGRIADTVREKHAAPLLRRDHGALLDAVTEQARELDAYFQSRRAAAAQSPEITALDFSSPDAFVRSGEPLRARLRASLGYAPASVPPPPADEAVVETPLGDDDLASYANLRIPVAPGVHGQGIYIRPKGRTDRLPLVIAAHGRTGPPERGTDGKTALLTHSNRDLERGAIERGYAVWVPTLIYFTRDDPDDPRTRLNIHAREAGTTLPAMEILKVTRSLDALSRRADLDPARVAMVGLSYGGFYTLYTTALDPRIKAAVVSAYFNDRETVLDGSEPNGFPDWRFPDSLTVLRDPFVAALVCPRPLQIQAGTQDQLFPVEGTRRTVPLAAEYYQRLGVPGRFQFFEFVGRHDFNGEAAWDFLDRQLAAGR